MHIPRFLSTALKKTEWKRLFDAVKDAELIIDASRLSRKQMIDKLNSAGKALTF